MDRWIKNFPAIRLTDQPGLPLLIEATRPPELQEGDELKIQSVVTGGTSPLRYLWQAGDGLQVTNEVLDLTAQAGTRLDAGGNVIVMEAKDLSGNATTNQTTLIWNDGSILVVGDVRDTSEGQRVEFLIQLKSVQSLSRISFNLRYAEYVDFFGRPRVCRQRLPSRRAKVWRGDSTPMAGGLDPFLPVKRQVIAILTD